MVEMEGCVLANHAPLPELRAGLSLSGDIRQYLLVMEAQCPLLEISVPLFGARTTLRCKQNLQRSGLKQQRQFRPLSISLQFGGEHHLSIQVEEAAFQSSLLLCSSADLVQVRNFIFFAVVGT